MCEVVACAGVFARGGLWADDEGPVIGVAEVGGGVAAGGSAAWVEGDVEAGFVGLRDRGCGGVGAEEGGAGGRVGHSGGGKGE